MSGRRRRWWSKEKKKIMVYVSAYGVVVDVYPSSPPPLANPLFCPPLLVQPSRRCAVKEMVVMVGVCVWCHCEPNTFPSPPHLLLSLAELAMNGFLGQWGVEVEHPSSVVRAWRVSASGWQVWGYQ
ncbi:hypothetical protein QJS10_CPB13g00999 [Acorus calamus]|uniref:Uncharacterized protein n=1 Tax=Acorus calamus TaxID=4465 RepID=A0AAV9DKU2_ACOCL|nr:hypothetical protein QJS10_CPB13g00999 [Acorus calamus]